MEATTEVTKQETSCCPETLPPSGGEALYIDRPASHAKKHRIEDVMMTQCILCLVLVLSIFGLHWISVPFQEQLLTLYQEKVDAPAEAFLAQAVHTVEQWLQG